MRRLSKSNMSRIMMSDVLDQTLYLNRGFVHTKFYYWKLMVKMEWADILTDELK